MGIKSINKDYHNINFKYEEFKEKKNFEKSYFNIFNSKSQQDEVSEFIDNNDSLNSDEINNNNLMKKTILLGEKKRRNDMKYKEMEKVIVNNKKLIFNIKRIEKKYIYRFDYYKMAFIGDFLKFVKKYIEELVNKCNFCKKFGKSKFHMANRELYAGNPKEEDNRGFINKTVEEVFTITKDNMNTLKLKRISRQLENGKIINIIYF